MKLVTVFAAVAIAACGAALAADPPAAPSATPVKHATLKSCNKAATAKKLTGKERAQFVKDCRDGKTRG
ncbi:MAG: PsiF family protein [Steroidobacteraceae bacterium]